ncbi:MAG: RecX family transcriptional regulator [Omnitrophica bacterium]|nr:RecX family transcriptional regulator [Candidatus Omnitrophota bacterium]
MPQAKELIKAKDYVYKLLSYCQRSTREVKERLRKKGFNPAVTRKTIKYLSEINYLNDQEFAKSWIRSKMQSSPVGRAVLRYQLRQKGITEEVLEQALGELSSHYDEFRVAKKLVASRRLRYKGLKDQKKLKKRLYDYLRRRGFSSETILQAINHKP